LKNEHCGIKRIVIRIAEIHFPYFLWLGCALFVIEESSDIKITFCNPHGSYAYPALPDILWPSQVLTDVSHNTSTGRTYILTSEETNLTTERSKA
jgi:hypothetical protein